jgi:hypothetical protein
MQRVALVFLGALFAGGACGGSTNASKSERSAAGSMAVAGTSASAAGATGEAGTVGSGGSQSLNEAGQGGEPAPPLGAGIAPEALEGCRGPSDPNCDVCYFPTYDGNCTRESGGTTEYLDYEGLVGPCPPEGPLCAQCSYRDEQRLRALGDRPECKPCGTNGNTAPCMAGSESCGCYCNGYNSVRRSCPTPP